MQSRGRHEKPFLHSACSIQCGPHGMYGVGLAVLLKRGGTALPFFSQYDCAGSAGTDVVAQDVSVVPDTGVPASGFCSPPLIMAGRLAQYVAEYKAPGVALLPDVQAYWFTLLQLATDRSIELAPAAANGCFRWPSTDSGLTNWWYSR